MSENTASESPKWHHPSEVMKLHKLKQKKRKLQARIKGNVLNDSIGNNSTNSVFDDIFAAKKRKNPFVKTVDPKRNKFDSPVLDESADQTLFKLLHQSDSIKPNTDITSFDNILSKLKEQPKEEVVEIVKEQGKKWLPIDWTLKNKVRLLSAEPFSWNQKLKLNEEASGITAFTRCLDNNTETNIDTSPNAKFHQCCLFWQQPSLPWLNLFPRSTNKSTNNVLMNAEIRDSLHQAWTDGLRSLFQLIRTRQCPYFYACSNNFTVLFRAAGICGFSDVHALIVPTTRGLRQALRQEEIEFTMPLKQKILPDQGYETWDSELDPSEDAHKDDEDDDDDMWLKNMGVNEADIKLINYTQEKIVQKSECEVDNSEQSLVVVEGVEIHALYNFLINCKSTTALTGHLAGVPPTLLAPVAFQGATLNSLKVRHNKVHLDDCNYHSLELLGPILPSTIHNLFEINPPENSMTATFNNIRSTEPFSKVKNTERPSDIENRGTVVFGKENLSDCGLLPRVLKHFCTPEKNHVTNVECLKYNCEDGTYTWS